jgi:predicted DNA-binding protein (MmcQ/YjbR family)
MVKETHHIFISLFLVQGRGDVGVHSFITQLYRLYNLQEARKPGKFLSKKSWVSQVASSSECWFHCIL